MPIKLLALTATGELPVRGNNSAERAGIRPLTGKLGHSALTCTQAQPWTLQPRKENTYSAANMGWKQGGRVGTYAPHSLKSHKSTLHVFFKMLYSD